MGAAQQGTAAVGRIVSINPATGVPLGDVPDLGEAEVRALVAKARAAAEAWGGVSLDERCRRVARFAEVLMERADEVIELVTREGGKTRQEALGMELMVVADLVRYFVRHAPKILAPEPIRLHLFKHRGSYLHFVPRGVIGIIAPWNFPFAIPMGEALMAVIAGNGVVLKPSEVTPLIALLAKELFDASGLPADLLQIATGRGATGAALIDAGIDYCVFTGSVATGKRVAAACGERLIPCTLELGGKAPAVVCADADLERAANAIAWGGLANSGQVCASVERVYVVKEVHDELVARVVAIASSLRQGDASVEGAEVDLGAMCWDRQLEHVAALVDAAVRAGAKVAHGGQRGKGGLFFQPTVLTDVRQDMEIMRKEIFGPVIPIMAVRDEDQAIELANDSHLGLLAYVFSRDKARARRLAERIEAGTVMINDVLSTYAAPETPWGGVKMSGIGRTHSAHGLRDLCQTRHVNYERLSLGAKEIWWYPYKAQTYKTLLRAARLLFGKRPWQR
ncbi:MAG: aldehyde dehydrogenase family protein [Myxococcales bacterium]|nr:aldehyde dehydrogenase family protein [Myxococcales bacterium]HRC56915.1 aldehyde dehydrogenase family protein [Kofleriaceae bacterium]